MYPSMQTEIRIIFVSVLVILAFSASGAFAQQQQSKCSQARYSERLTNAYPYRLKGIEGQAVYGEVSERGELKSASSVCVALFNQKDKRRAKIGLPPLREYLESMKRLYFPQP
jgi:hypothetical protein